MLMFNAEKGDDGVQDRKIMQQTTQRKTLKKKKNAQNSSIDNEKNPVLKMKVMDR